VSNLKRFIRTVPDFPKPGIQFRDITSLCAGPGFDYTVTALCDIARIFNPTDIVGIESRGFVFGAPMAYTMSRPLILARKPGKLPNQTVSKSYDLEYGSATIEVQTCESLTLDSRVVIIDDLIATGGTAHACAELIHEQFGVSRKNIMILAVIDLPDLGGSTMLREQGYAVRSVMEFEGD
jgi:adenine phosphoribosyltransferase